VNDFTSSTFIVHVYWNFVFYFACPVFFSLKLTMTCQILGCFYAIHFIAVKLGANHVTIVLLVKFGFYANHCLTSQIWFCRTLLWGVFCRILIKVANSLMSTFIINFFAKKRKLTQNMPLKTSTCFCQISSQQVECFICQRTSWFNSILLQTD